MAMIAPSASTVASDIWAYFGTELVIFAVTLMFAFIIRRITTIHGPDKRGTKKEAGVSRAKGASIDTSYPVVQKPKMDSPLRGTNALRTIGGNRSQACRGRDGNHAAGRHGWSKHGPPSEVVNDIVEGVRDNQGIHFVFRALLLYDEMKAQLEMEGLSIPGVALLSRHSAVELYTTLIQCAMRTNQHDRIECLIDEMVQQGVSRSLLFYEGTMKQLAGQKKYQLALAVYDRLEADGIEPSAVTCSCLISFAVEAGEYERALAFFDKLSKTTTPSIRACMTVLRVHSKRQDWKSSVATLWDMRHRGVVLDSLALNIVLATGVAAGQLDAVNELLKEADKLEPPISDVVSFNTLIKGYAQHSDVDGALQAIDRMRGRGLKPNAITFNTAMDAAVRAGRCSDAWKVMKDMRAAWLPPDKFTCSILVKTVAQARDAQQVETTLSLLLEADAAFDNMLRSSMYHTTLEAAGRIGDASLMTKAFAQMRQHNVTLLPPAQRLLLKTLPGNGVMEG